MKRSVWRDFLNLPPFIRFGALALGVSLLALLGWFVLPALISPAARGWLLLVMGAGAATGAAVWGLGALLRKRGLARFADALRTQSLTRGEASEQTEVLRDKFTRKLGELKANGLSVYRLPWFVLMGEPGCGKTYTLIHSGLSFPLGKDEVPGFGGTRNYNWWFTDEAVILDTAGRIAFHEEGTTDKAEWEFFLKLLRRNRPRCPINGVVVALPADKLLRDDADQRMQKAMILRDRLRQVQQQLGVRFPVFLLVTKMDLVGGFNEFSEEIRVDLAARNQLFGWSRPGEFQAPYDPGECARAFGEVAERVRDWSLRYLQREVADDERLLITTFPESFRALADPLNDYASVIFKKSVLVEPPFFRGFYFTSSVQEGVPILDVLKRARVGAGLAERPPRPVDSKAFFIHDTYANKVFPEAGLVFRSNADVLRNRWARRLVTAAAVLFVAGVSGLFAFGSYSVRGLVTAPQADCRLAAERIEQARAGAAGGQDLRANLDLAQRLDRHAQSYASANAALAARMVSIVADIRTPRAHVEQIHASLVAHGLVKPALSLLERRLEGASALPDGDARETLVNALATYASWCGDVLAGRRTGTAAQRAAPAAEFGRLLAALDLDERTRGGLAEQLRRALDTPAGAALSFERDVLGRMVALDGEKGVQTVARLATDVMAGWKNGVDVSERSADSSIAFWAGLAARVEAVRGRYAELLDASAKLNERAQADAALAALKTLLADAETFGDPNAAADARSVAHAYNQLARFLSATTPPRQGDRILRPSPAANVAEDLTILGRQKAAWAGQLDPLEDALGLAEKASGGRVTQTLEAMRQARVNLANDLARALSELSGRLLGELSGGDPLAALRDAGLIEFAENQGSTTPRVTVASRAIEPVRSRLVALNRLVRAEAAPPSELPRLGDWPERLTQAASETDAAPSVTSATADAGSFWRVERLQDVSASLMAQQTRQRRVRLLDQMVEAVEKDVGQPGMARFSRPGLPRLVDERWQQPAAGLPFPSLSTYHTRGLLIDTLVACERVRAACEQVEGAGRLKDALDRAADAYLTEYFADWLAVCAEPGRLHAPEVLALLGDCGQAKLTWADFVTRLRAIDPQAAITQRVAAIRENTVEAGAGLNPDQEPLAAARLARATASVKPGLARVLEAGTAERVTAWLTFRDRLTGDAGALARVLDVPADGDALAPWGPFVALAGHAPALARHALQQRVHDIVNPLAGKFPIAEKTTLGQLASQPVADTDAFLAMLRAVAQARQELPVAGDLPNDAPGARTLERCLGWSRFLYGAEAPPNETPKAIDGALWVTIVEGKSEPSRFYARFRLGLPIVDELAKPAASIEERSDKVIRLAPSKFTPTSRPPLRRFSWQLAPRDGLQPAKLELYEPVAGKASNPLGFQLSNSPWALLQLLSVGDELPSELRGVPVEFEVGGGERVFVTLIVQLGAGERAFPGLIPAPAPPGGQPILDAARFLKQPKGP